MSERLEVKNIYSLSPLQQGMLFHSILDSSSYSEQVVMGICGELDIDLLEKSFNKMIERHDIFRTNFIYEKIKKPQQVVLKKRTAKVRYEDLSAMDEGTRISYIEDFAVKDREKGFDLSRDMLIRISVLKKGAGEYTLVWGFHHMILDGWCLGIILEEFFKIYKSLRDGETIRFEEAYPYSCYIRWIEEQNHEDAIAYWKDLLKGYAQRAIVPFDGQKKNSQGVRFESYKFTLNEQLTEKLAGIAKNDRVTLNTVFQAVWGILLQRYNYTDDVVFGSVVSGRPPQISGIEKMVGLFINTVPVRVVCKDGMTFSELIRLLQKAAFTSEKYCYLTLADIQKETELKQDLLDHVIVYENYPLQSEVRNITPDQELGFSIGDTRLTGQTSYNFNIVVEPGKSLNVDFRYNSLVYGKEFIRNIGGHFMEIAENVARNPDIEANTIEILTEEEKRRITVEFNNTVKDYPKNKAIHQIFEEQVEKSPENLAVIYGDTRLSYRQLNYRANQFARWLKENGVDSNSKVALVMPRSIEMLTGVLGVMKAGGCLIPIDVNYPPERIKMILEDSGTGTIVTSDAAGLGEDYAGKVLNVYDEGIGAYNTDNLLSEVDLNSPAYIIYTSGSTGKPKGTALMHSGIINHIYTKQDVLKINEEDILCSNFSINFVASVWQIITPLLVGAQLLIYASGVEKDPYEQFERVAKDGVTVLEVIPSVLSNYLSLLESGKRKIELPSLKAIALTGEECKPEVVNKFFRYYKTDLVNCYGQTECSDDTLHYRIPFCTKTSIVPIGKPSNNTRVYILGMNNQIQPVGIMGELCISGDGVTAGYLNREELTAQKFVPNPFEAGNRMFKTGDLARWMPDGNVEYCGRVDHQVKIRGNRIELGEVEDQILKHEAVRDVVVTAVEEGEDRYLCAYYTLQRDLKTSALREYLLEKLPDYMVPSFFVELEELPLTPNGKVDRKALPEPKKNIQTGSVYLEPRNDLERKLAAIWKDILNVERVGVYDTFFELGGHSISMIQAIARIGKELGTDIKLKDFINAGCIARLAETLTERHSSVKNTKYVSYPADLDNIDKPFPLTEIQMAYLLGREELFEMGGVSTHGYLEVEMDLDIDRFNRSLNKVINRHPMMRAIILPGGVQRILKEVPFYTVQVEDIACHDKSTQEVYIVKERERMSHYVFQTDRWPLFEIKAFKISDQKYYIFMGYDLLIADGTSTRIIAKELKDFYDNPEILLPCPEFSFRDYVLAYTEFKKSEAYAADKEFWMNRLDNFPLVPLLPLKQNPSAIQKPHFKRQSKVFDKQSWDTLKRKAKERNVTPSALLCTAYAEVLAFWSNQTDFSINLTVFNRYPFHEDVNKIVGDFTSVLLIEISMKPLSSFWDKVREVQNTLLEALEHRHFDGIEFIRELSRKNNLGTKAAMPIVFTSALFNSEQDNQGFGVGDGVQKAGISQTSQVYLDHQAMEMNGSLKINWDYVDELFDEEIIHTMFKQYIGILESIIRSDSVYELSPAESDCMLAEKYNMTQEVILPTTLQRLFSEQASLTPQNIAVISGTEHITYKELDEKSGRIAHYLTENGVSSGDMIGVIAKRCIETIINVMGILKSGAAYVPVDPDYPEERKKYIIENSSCKMLIGPEFYRERNVSRYPGYYDIKNDHPNSTAYVIYTSGSTGKPKGVVITHKAVTNTIIDINRKFNVNESDRILGISSMCFDLSVYDVFGALSTGAALVIVPDQRDVINLIDSIKRYGITIWNSVPAIMDMTVDNINTGEGVEQDLDSKSDTLYYWSPVKHWLKKDNEIIIDENSYAGIAAGLFPKMYFLTQNGVTLEQLKREFSDIDNDKLNLLLEEFIGNKVLINSLQQPKEIFSTQKKLFKNTYSERIIIDADELRKFKTKQLSRSFHIDKNLKIRLNDSAVPDYVSRRRTYRHFIEDRKMPLASFSELLSVLRQRMDGEEIRYYYASAGGLYPVDVYIYAKKDRIEGVTGGLYYYHPSDNSLNLIKEGEFISDEAHYFTNKQIFNSSAFSVFFIYNADVNMPKYGPMGYQYALIDCGIMVSTLTQAAEHLDIGLCSIGNMEFHKIESFFKLNENQIFIHAVEGGMKLYEAGANREVVEMYGEQPGNMGTKENSECHIADKCQEDTVAEDYICSDRKGLRLVLLSGDWIPLTLPGKVKRHFPDAQLVSLGGATEASIWSIYYPVDEVNKGWKSIPYGMPLANQEFYVLNYEHKLCPVGVIGELYIGGIGVAEGYLNDNEKTRGAFLNHPQYGYIYRTGDYGVLHKEGYIEFLGRKDHQIKIRGFRIELGEIESCILRYDGVKNAIVTDLNDEGGRKYLCAYIVSGREINASDFKSYLSKYLPDYMVPSHFIRIESIPVTPNGKVDKNALPKPLECMDTGKEYVEAGNEIEKKLVALWQKELNTDRIGVNDNFFELGGNSVMLVRIYTKLQQMYPGKIKITDIFANPAISKLARFIDNEQEKSRVPDVRYNISTLTLPPEYFHSSFSGYTGATLKFTVEGMMYERMTGSARNEQVYCQDIFMAIYAYLLSQISGKSDVTVHAMTEETGKVHPVTFQTEGVSDFSRLIKQASSHSQANSASCYEIGAGMEINADKDRYSIIPLFYDKTHKIESFDLLKVYDLIIEVSEEKGLFNVICKYDGKRLRSEKIKEFVQMYSKIVQIFVEQYGNG